jgi:hypothetical protein
MDTFLYVFAPLSAARQVCVKSQIKKLYLTPCAFEIKNVTVKEPIREPLLFTTVAHSSIEAPSRKRDVCPCQTQAGFSGRLFWRARRRLGTFLAKQKSTNNI